MKNHPKTKRTGHAAPRKRQERPAPAETAQKATAAKRARRTASPQAPPRESKRAAVLLLLQREGGVSLDEIVAATGWQRHTCRGFLSILCSKGGHQVTAATREDGVRMYTAK